MQSCSALVAVRSWYPGLSLFLLTSIDSVILSWTGTYVLSSVTAIGLFDASTAKRVKLLRVDDNDFLCYITDTRLTVLKWNMGTLTFSSLQVLTTDGGVDVDIIRAYPSTYLVVLEKAWTVFAGGFYSRIYYYDPWSGMFDTSTPVLFKVEEPTALDTFHVFGEPFLAIVNYRTTTGKKRISEVLVFKYSLHRL